VTPKPRKHWEVLDKYWYQRYRFFSLWDEGALIDDDSWFTICPEKLSIHIAERCRSDTVVDAFCGCGSNAIQFAMTCHHVIAIDIDAEKIRRAKHNAHIYGVGDRIEFIVGDSLKILPKLKADVAFLSPPWGGPGYIENDKFSARDIQFDPIYQVGDRKDRHCDAEGKEMDDSRFLDGFGLLRLAQSAAPNVAIFMPRNFDKNDMLLLRKQYVSDAKVVACAGGGIEQVDATGATCGATADAEFEVEDQYLNGKLKSVTIYFGEFCEV
jgi:trimethylguanosine synthase